MEADISTPGLVPPSVYQMGTSGALLSYLEGGVVEDGIIGAGLNAELATRAFLGVNDNQPIGPIL